MNPAFHLKTNAQSPDVFNLEGSFLPNDLVLERVQQRLDRKLDAMTLRRRTVEHVFGTLKHWMGATHFLTKTLVNVRTEMSLYVLAYNLKRVISIFVLTQ